MMLDMIQLVRVAKRIKAATGYLELGMAQQTLDCLEGLGELGPLEAEVQLLRGQALQRQHRYHDAEQCLKTAAKKFPSPLDRAAWLAWYVCYQHAGHNSQAVQMLACARGAAPKGKAPK